MSKATLIDLPEAASILNEFVDDLIDSCLMDGILAMHRAIKLGYFHVIAPEPPSDEVLDNPSHGLPGQTTRDQSNKATSCCRCGKCNCKVAATRYAVHLSNCMGLGRNSSRRANKRIAEQQRLEDYDTETDDGYTMESSSSESTQSKTSIIADNMESRYTSSTVNRHHSPLKLTISLLPSTGKVEINSKHQNRTNESTMMDQSRLVGPNSEANPSKAGFHPHNKIPMALNEVTVTLSRHDFKNNPVN